MYLDPGSWSMVLQVLAGVVLSGLALIGIYWNRIKAYFRRGKNAKSNN